MKKKFLSLVLAAALCLGLCAPALAAAPAETGAEVHALRIAYADVKRSDADEVWTSWNAARGVYVAPQPQPEPEPAPAPEPEPEPAPEPEPGPVAVLANGQPITEANVQAILYGLKDEYPEGLHWTNDNGYYSEATPGWSYGGCAAFAMICSDAAFGLLPIVRRHADFSAIRPGDILRINNNTHSVVVLEVRADSVIVTEGNYNSSIHWGREISRSSLEAGNYEVSTRYPEGT